jgi:hypothetical protein
MAELKDIVEQFALDKTKEADGVWSEIALATGDVLEVKIAKWFNKAHRAKYLAVMSPHAAAIDAGELSDEDANRLHAEGMVGTVLTDWRGLTIGGKDKEYSDDAALVLLSELDTLREEIAKRSRQTANYMLDNLDAAAERLGKLLNGGSSTATDSENPPTETE